MEPVRLTEVEHEFRAALRAIAGAGRVLEVNTVRTVEAEILRWWREEGGRAVTVGSDAHRPDDVARDFRRAEAVVGAQGFRPGQNPWDPWTSGG